MEHHDIDLSPIPEDKGVIFINEPWIVDGTIESVRKDPEVEDDNIRIYVPIDINRRAILRRLDAVIGKYGDATEDNEFNYSTEVDKLVSQIEIYDQVWFVRNMPSCGKHSNEAKELVKEFVVRLRNIPDGCSEYFPFEVIKALEAEYL